MNKFYFLGIGGISMSSLAVMMKDKGFEVGGSDEMKSRATELLEENGIEIDFSLNEEKITNSDVVVFSSAIKEDNPQFVFAKKSKKKILTRGQLLGKISDEYENVIAVAGSHGKTTTTALIYEILKAAGFSPTLHLGGFRIEDGKNFYLGEKEFFVTEACEYHDNFLNLHPTISVVTNVEKEHMDYFKTFERQLSSFRQFKKQSRYVIENQEDYVAKNVRHDRQGGLIFNLCFQKKKIMRLHLKICEEINVQNCIYAYLVAKKLKIPDSIIKLGLENFKGVSTRFEKVQCPYFETVICDYAHHPTEIEKAIITANKIFKNKEVVTIFQPHTFSRTKNLLEDFVKVFEKTKLPIFFKTYPARESPENGLSAFELVEKIKKINKNALYFDNFNDLQEFLLTLDSKGNVLLFLGAGDLPSILHKNNFIS